MGLVALTNRLTSVTKLVVGEAEPPAVKMSATAASSEPPRGQRRAPTLLVLSSGAPVDSSIVGRRLEPVSMRAALYTDDARAAQEPVAFVTAPVVASSARGTASTPRSHTVEELADELATTIAHFEFAATDGKCDILNVTSTGPAAARGTARGREYATATEVPVGTPVAATLKNAAVITICVTFAPCTAPAGTCTMIDAVSNERANALDRTTPAAVRAPIDRPSELGRHDVSDAVLSRKMAAIENVDTRARHAAKRIFMSTCAHLKGNRGARSGWSVKHAAANSASADASKFQLQKKLKFPSCRVAT